MFGLGLQPRTRWRIWAALSVTAVGLALIDPPWLRTALLVLALVGLNLLGLGPQRRRRRHWEALLGWPADHPLRAMARRAVGPTVLVGAAFAGLAWPLPDHPRLQSVALAVGLAGLADSAAVFHRTEALVAEQERFSPTPVDRQPEPGWSHTYAELWTDEPELPAAEANRWRRFVERAADAGSEARDDLDNIDRWSETPPPEHR